MNKKLNYDIPVATLPAPDLITSPKKSVGSSGSPHKQSSGAAPPRATQRYGEELVGGQAAPTDASKPRRSSLPSLALVLECVEAQQRPHMSALRTIERDVAARAAAALDGAPNPPHPQPEPSCPVPRVKPQRQPRQRRPPPSHTELVAHRFNPPKQRQQPRRPDSVPDDDQYVSIFD